MARGANHLFYAVWYVADSNFVVSMPIPQSFDIISWREIVSASLCSTFLDDLECLRI